VGDCQRTADVLAVDEGLDDPGDARGRRSRRPTENGSERGESVRGVGSPQGPWSIRPSHHCCVDRAAVPLGSITGEAGGRASHHCCRGSITSEATSRTSP
jgi:hypothetical protein